MAGKLGMRHGQIKYSRRIALKVLDLMEQGNTLTQLCDIIENELGLNLKPYTVLGWRRHHPEFAEAYELAYDSRSALWSDELYTIASEPLPIVADKVEMNAELARRKMMVSVLTTLLNKHRPTPQPAASQKTSQAAASKTTQEPPAEFSIVTYSDTKQ